MGRKKKLVNNTIYPQHMVDSFARALMPAAIAFFESEEGKREFEEWEAYLRSVNVRSVFDQ